MFFQTLNINVGSMYTAARKSHLSEESSNNDTRVRIVFSQKIENKMTREYYWRQVIITNFEIQCAFNCEETNQLQKYPCSLADGTHKI